MSVNVVVDAAAVNASVEAGCNHVAAVAVIAKKEAVEWNTAKMRRIWE